MIYGFNLVLVWDCLILFSISFSLGGFVLVGAGFYL